MDMKDFAELVMNEIKSEVATLPHIPSYTCYIISNENGEFDPASEKYVSLKHRTSTLAGIDCIVKKLDVEDFKAEMIRISMSYDMNGGEPLRAMLQLPAPKEAVELFYRYVRTGYIIDVDHLGADVLHDMWDGKFDRMPATPRGIVAYIMEKCGSISGKKIAIIGSRSKTTGRYLAPILQHFNATVSMYHSRSVINEGEFKDYAIVISCVGKPKFLDISHFGTDTDKLIVDVGVSVVYGKVVGDIHENVREHHDSNPWTNAVGLLTRTFLIRNVLDTYFIWR